MLITLFGILLLSYGCKIGSDIHEDDEIRIETNVLHSFDGPYIYDRSDSLEVVSVKQGKDSTFYISKTKVQKQGKPTFSSTINNEEGDTFSFRLANGHEAPESNHQVKGNLFVTSDIEGNFNAFYGLLVANKVMDSSYNWTFGTGHLVICGDMFDRGTEVLPTLWLLYKLELAAEKSGGQVHYILGNHDVMNLYMDIRYIDEKYLELARIISGINDDDEAAYAYLMSNANVLVPWIKSKNAIEKIGETLYLHGGISEDLVNAGLTLDVINDVVRESLKGDLTDTPSGSEEVDLIFGSTGPFWYRGLVVDRKERYNKIEESKLDEILAFYGATQIVVGHTIVSEAVTGDFNGKVIRVDIKHPKEKFTGKAEAMLIENETYYRVNDLGEKFEMIFKDVN